MTRKMFKGYKHVFRDPLEGLRTPTGRREGELFLGDDMIPVYVIDTTMTLSLNPASLDVPNPRSSESIVIVLDQANTRGVAEPQPLTVQSTFSVHRLIELAAWCGMIPEWVKRVSVIHVDSARDEIGALSTLGGMALYSECKAYDRAVQGSVPPMIKMREIGLTYQRTRPLQKFSSNAYPRFHDKSLMEIRDDDVIRELLFAHKAAAIRLLRSQLAAFTDGETRIGDSSKRRRKRVNREMERAIELVTANKRSFIPALDLMRATDIISDMPPEFYRVVEDANDKWIRREDAPSDIKELMREIDEIEDLQRDIDRAGDVWDVLVRELGYHDKPGVMSKNRIEEVVRAAKNVGIKTYMDAAIDHGVPAKDMFGMSFGGVGGTSAKGAKSAKGTRAGMFGLLRREFLIG